MALHYPNRPSAPSLVIETTKDYPILSNDEFTESYFANIFDNRFPVCKHQSKEQIFKLMTGETLRSSLSQD